MKFEIPMIATLEARLKASISLKGLVDAEMTVEGPIDSDKDGDPEFKLHINLPGELFDKDFTVEVPLSQTVEGVNSLFRGALNSAPDFPFKALLIKILAHT